MKHHDAQSYPLSWPDGWPRTKSRIVGHPFGSRVYELTFDRARRSLRDELGRLGARQVVLSTNVPLRLDGEAYADAARRRMDDPGVAVYFMLGERPMVMAQDHYSDVSANIRSLGLAIEGMRQLKRHGGGVMMERAFAGFAALPPPEGSAAPKRPWWTVLNYGEDPEARADLSAEEVEARFKTLAKRRHPDGGGSVEAFAELVAARDEAVRALS